VARCVAPLRSELAAIASLLGASAAGRPPRPAPVDAPLAFAALRPGRALSYYWSDDLGWAAGVCAAAPASDRVPVDFDGGGDTKHLPLLVDDRARWKLPPL